jgi:addiction module RelE/StbE family toxin
LKRLDWTPQAIADLKEAWDYIAADNEAAANKIIDRIETAANTLTAFPLLGRPGHMKRTREFGVTGTPYILIYVPDSASIQVLRVLHGAREWPPKRRRP